MDKLYIVNTGLEEKKKKKKKKKSLPLAVATFSLFPPAPWGPLASLLRLLTLSFVYYYKCFILSFSPSIK